MSRPKRKKHMRAKLAAQDEARAAKRSKYAAKEWEQQHGKPPRTREEQQRQKEGS